MGFMAFLSIVLLLAGCAGLKESSREPIHAQSGIGLTLGKHVVIGLGAWHPRELAIGYPPVVIYQPPTPTAPSPGQPQPQGSTQSESQAQVVVVPSPPPPPFKRFFPATPFNDPTRVTLLNVSDRAPILISIDDDPPSKIEPGDLWSTRLGPGTHTVTWWGEVPTGHPDYPVLKTPKKTLTVRIDGQGRPQVLFLPE